MGHKKKRNKRCTSDYDKYHHQFLKLLKKNVRSVSRGDAELTIDHIYPYNGETVCGFDCYQNLILVTTDYNGKKGNKLLDETEETVMSEECKQKVVRLFGNL